MHLVAYPQGLKPDWITGALEARMLSGAGPGLASSVDASRTISTTEVSNNPILRHARIKQEGPDANAGQDQRDASAVILQLVHWWWRIER